jgi:APA family basic amino acid/polyamine antiporter
VGADRRPHARRGAVLWRTGRDDAARRRQYVYLREAFSPLWGFLYGWTLFMVIQTGTIAAVAVGFARYTGFSFRGSPRTTTSFRHSSLRGYAVSLSTVQLLASARSRC